MIKNKNLVKKVIAAVAVAGGLALLAPSAAVAGSQSQSFTLPAGSRVCIDDPTLAYTSARAEGQANPGVKFTFLVKPAGSYSYQLIAESPGSVTYWAAEANRYWQPWAFPGQFRTCARNLGTSSSQVLLSLTSS